MKSQRCFLSILLSFVFCSIAYTDEIPEHAAFVHATIRDTEGRAVDNVRFEIDALGYPVPQCIDEWTITCSDWEYSNGVDTEFYLGCGVFEDWCYVDWITTRLRPPVGYVRAPESDPFDITERFQPPAPPGATLSANWILERGVGYDPNGVPVAVELFKEPPNIDQPGRLISELVNYPQSEGSQTVHWDGTKLNGELAPAGDYIWRRRVGKCDPKYENFTYDGTGGYDLSYDVSRATCDTTSKEEFYKALAERFSPVFAQAWTDPGGNRDFADFIIRFNYDGNWEGNDNADHNRTYYSGDYDFTGHVYYSVVETEHHWFITYAVFHPEDFKSAFPWDHENDLEGLVVAVEKYSTVFGRFLAAVTLAHNIYYFTTNHWLLENEDDDHPYFLETWDEASQEVFPIEDRGTHLIVMVENEGHGVYPYEPCMGTDIMPCLQFDIAHIPYGNSPDKIYTNHLEPSTPPGMPNADNNLEFVHYELVEITNTLWATRRLTTFNTPWPDRTYEEYMTYSHVLLNDLDPNDQIGSKFYGNSGWNDASARPPWGWTWDPLMNNPISPRGDLFFNPASVFSEQWGQLVLTCIS